MAEKRVASKEAIAKVQPVVLEIFERILGVTPELDLDMANLDFGVEEIWEMTVESFGLPDGWTGDGRAINGTLAQYIAHVAAMWDGKTLRRAKVPG